VYDAGEESFSEESQGFMVFGRIEILAVRVCGELDIAHVAISTYVAEKFELVSVVVTHVFIVFDKISKWQNTSPLGRN